MRIAIIGASKDRKKFSNKAVRAYKYNDHVVFPINPHEREIEGLKCYSSLLEVPIEVDVASIYLPPELGIKMVDLLAIKGVQKVYLNPGTESQELIKKLHDQGIMPLMECSILAIGIDPRKL